MNRLVYSIFLICCLKGAAQDRLQDGYYVAGDRLFTICFVKVSGETAIADFIHIEKFPRSLQSDTLVWNTQGNKWEGKFAAVSRKGSRYFISRNKFRMRLKQGEAYYKEHADRKKNQAIARKLYEDFIYRPGYNESDGKKYESLLAKYRMEEMMSSPHEEFLKVFAKFRAELEE